MRNARWYLLAKTIHRWFVFIIVVIGLVMMMTGLSMYADQYFLFSPVFVRTLHNRLSIFFSAALGVMMLTGIYLFVFPYLPKPQNEEKT